MTNPSGLYTASEIANKLQTPLGRVAYVLKKQPDIPAAALDGTERLFDEAAQERIKIAVLNLPGHVILNIARGTPNDIDRISR